MAIFSYADLSATMPQLYRDLVPQVQRKTVLLRLIPIKQPVDPKGPAWDVSFSGQAAGAVNLDGGNFLTATADPKVAARLDWASYSAPVKVTDRARMVGAAHPAGYQWLARMIDQNVAEATQALTKLLNQHLYSGTGSSNQLTSLSLAVLTSGTYANIAASSYSEWAASRGVGNSGTPQNWTLAQIKSDTSTIASDAGNPFGRPDWLIVTPTQFNTIENAFDTYARVVYDSGTAQLTMPGGNQERVSMNPNVITTPGGAISRTGFRAMKWENQNLWIIEDPDCTHTGQTNPTNTGFYLNSASIWLEYLPPAPSSLYSDQRTVQAVEQDLGSIANLQFELRPRGRQAFADEADLICAAQLVINSRSSTGYRTDAQ